MKKRKFPALVLFFVIFLTACESSNTENIVDSNNVINVEDIAHVEYVGDSIGRLTVGIKSKTDEDFLDLNYEDLFFDDEEEILNIDDHYIEYRDDIISIELGTFLDGEFDIVEYHNDNPIFAINYFGEEIGRIMLDYDYDFYYETIMAEEDGISLIETGDRNGEDYIFYSVYYEDDDSYEYDYVVDIARTDIVAILASYDEEYIKDLFNDIDFIVETNEKEILHLGDIEETEEMESLDDSDESNDVLEENDVKSEDEEN